MDVGGAGGIDSPRTEFPNGHSAKDHAFGLVVPREHNSISYEKSFDFHCAETPTSWTVNVTFVRLKSEHVTYFTYIKRTDDGPGLVNVQFWAAVHMNTNRFDVFYAKHFISRISAGRGEREVPTHFTSCFEAKGLEGVEVRIQFLFIVHGCHRVQYTFEGWGETEEAVCTDTTDRGCPSPKKMHLS